MVAFSGKKVVLRQKNILARRRNRRRISKLAWSDPIVFSQKKLPISRIYITLLSHNVSRRDLRGAVCRARVHAAVGHLIFFFYLYRLANAPPFCHAQCLFYTWGTFRNMALDAQLHAGVHDMGKYRIRRHPHRRSPSGASGSFLFFQFDLPIIHILKLHQVVFSLPDLHHGMRDGG